MKSLLSISFLFPIAFFLGFSDFSKVSDGNDSEIRTVVIDPGHGGEDLGSEGEHAKEKDIALAVSLQLGALISDHYPDVQIIYTRTIDTFVTLNDRADLANQNDADVFISIHCNAVRGNTKVNGVETYVLGTDGQISDVARRENEVIYLEDEFERSYGLDPSTPQGVIKFGMYQNAFLAQSILLAANIQKEAEEYANRKVRMVKQDKFVVLRLTNMPSVLVEMGFVTNPEEENYLVSLEGQAEMSIALFRAFKNYKNEIEGVEER